METFGGNRGNQGDRASTRKYVANVVMRPWRVVYAIKSPLEPQTIKYTIEAESWNKAYLRALDEMQEIMSLLNITEDKISIKSVTAIGG